MRRRITTRVLVVVLAAGALGAAAWYRRAHPPLPEVAVATARSAPLVAEWSATGYVEARVADVSAPGVGRITDVLVREGDAVAAGEVLARLAGDVEAAAVRVQEEGVAAAQARADSAREALREAERAYGDRVARARAEVAAARARWRQAEASLDRSRRTARANLAAARAQADEARAHLADLEKGARPEEIARAEAAVAAAAATAVRARKEEARFERLLAQGAVPRRALEEAQESLARAEASLEQARESLNELRAGARPEAIKAARARVRAADEQAAAAEAQVAGLEVDARLVDEAAAGARAAEAALAETRSGEARLEALRHDVRAAEAGAGQAGASVQQAQAGLAERTVTAPFPGVVGRRFVDPGDVASPAQPLFSIVGTDQAWVTAEVDAQDLAPVREGAGVAITVPAYPGRAFRGRIATVGSQALPQTEARTSARVVRVRVSLDPTPADERRLLKPGMEVDVAGQDTLVARALLVPNDALLADTGGTYVLLVAGDRVVRRRVAAGYANGRDTEIRSGLRAGDRVVVSGKEGLAPGARVRPVTYHE